ncbi:MAG: ATP-binding protein [Chloroflexi bacterium]|nr:ATP-binding protein [Chloroflexota bacterium]
MSRPLSIRVRLTLWYVALLAIILAVFGAGIFFTLRQSLYGSLDDSIQVQAAALLDAIRLEDDRPVLAVGPSQGSGNDERFTRIFDASLELTYDDTAPNAVPVDRDALMSSLLGETSNSRVGARHSGEPMRTVIEPIRLDGRIVGVLEVGQSEEDVADTLLRLLLIMGGAYPVTLALAVFGGMFLARRALAPVERVTGLARRITAEDLSQRLDLQLPDDEVGRLASTFDEMIARLDDAFRRQRRFTADASHELRTPLTIMKGQLDVALQKEREPEDYRNVLQAVNDEVDRLIHLAGSLLTLTRADAREIPLSLEDVAVADLVEGAVDHLQSIAGQQNVELSSVSGNGVTVRADEDLLIQLLLNLLDNAIKHTPAGGRVTVGWSETADDVEMWVRDTGEGISEEHVPRIFDRFYRVDQARSRSDGGAGLGLAISRWIAEAHGGSIRVESAPGEGSTLTPVSSRQIAMGKLIAALSIWVAVLVASFPYAWILRVSPEAFFDAIGSGALVGTLLAVAFACLGLIISIFSGANRVSMVVSAFLFIAMLAPSQLPGGATKGWLGEFLVRINPVASGARFMDKVIVANHGWGQETTWLVAPIIAFLLGLVAAVILSGRLQLHPGFGR